MKHEFNASQVPNVTWLTINNILRDCGTDGVAMYLRYVYVSGLKMTNQPRITTEYMENGLGWGRDKVQKVRKQLEAFEYITIIKERDIHGYLSKNYIKVNKIVSFKKMQSLEPENTFLGSQSLEPGFTAEVKHVTNNLKDNKINNLKDIEEEEDIRKTFSTGKVDATNVDDITGAKGERKPALDTQSKASNQSKDEVVNTILAYAKEAWIDQPVERITPVTKEQIKKRLNEGFTLEDFKKAIDDSCFWARTVPKTLAVLTKNKSTFNGFVTWQDRTPEMYDRYGRNYSE